MARPDRQRRRSARPNDATKTPSAIKIADSEKGKKIAGSQHDGQQFSAPAKKRRDRRIPEGQQKKRGRQRSEDLTEELLDFYAYWGRWPIGLSKPMQKYYSAHPKLCVEQRRVRVGTAGEELRA